MTFKSCIALLILVFVVQAVCCDDYIHCCPEGYKCDTAAGSCLQGAVSVPWARKVPAKPAPVTAKVADVNECPCDPGSTCCHDKCCPFINVRKVFFSAGYLAYTAIFS